MPIARFVTRDPATGKIRPSDLPSGFAVGTGTFSRWYTATVNPTALSGNLNDFHLNTATGDFFEKTSTNFWTLKGNLQGPSGPEGPRGSPGPAGTDTTAEILANVVNGTSYQLQAVDNGRIVEFTAATAVTCTIPNDATVGFLTGTVIELMQIGPGPVTVSAASGVTIETSGLRTLRAQNSIASLRKRASNTWVLAGDMAEIASPPPPPPPPPTPAINAPSAPTSLTPANLSSTSVTLVWTEATAPAEAPIQGYRIYQVGATTPKGSVGAAARNFTVSGLNTGFTYQFYVVAYSAAGEGFQSPTVTVVPGGSGSTVYSPPGTIDDTGATDVGPALQTWIAGLPNNSIIDFGTGNYRLERAVKMVSRTGLTLRGGNFFRQTNTTDPTLKYPNPNPWFWFTSCTNCTVQNAFFRGPNTVSDQAGWPTFGAYLLDYEFDAAIRAEQFTNFTVSGCDMDGIWGDGIQLQVGNSATITNNKIDRIGRQGVTIIARNVLVDGTDVLRGRRSGFDLEPDLSSQAVSDIEIRNCSTNTVGLFLASQGNGAVNNVWVHNNTSAGSAVPIIHCRASDQSRRSNWRFEDHTAVNGLGSPVAAMRFFYVTNLRVARVNLPVVTTQSRLALQMEECGGLCEIVDSQFGGGTFYQNRLPVAQTLVLQNNTPALTEIP